MKKVVWLSNAPAPYKVAFMSELGKYTELTCLFETRAEKDRNAEWYDYSTDGFKAVYLPETDSRAVIRQAAEDADILIDSDYTKQIARYAVRMFHKYKKPVIMHADGGLAVPRGPLDLLIRAVMKSHDGFLSSGEITDRYFSYYRVNPGKMMHYRFACASTEELAQNRAMRERKEELRRELKVREDIMILSVGQPIHRKGFDILMEAMKQVHGNIGLYIIGGQPEEEVRKAAAEVTGAKVYFLPFLSRDVLDEHYAAADIFVLPTRYDIWGLVVNEAMSFGLPVVSTDHCVAALELVGKNKCGEIVPVGDAGALAAALQKRADDPELCRAEGERSFAGIAEYDYAHMAQDFAETLNKF